MYCGTTLLLPVLPGDNIFKFIKKYYSKWSFLLSEKNKKIKEY
jgi:hypothetical protein